MILRMMEILKLLYVHIYENSTNFWKLPVILPDAIYAKTDKSLKIIFFYDLET